MLILELLNLLEAKLTPWQQANKIAQSKFAEFGVGTLEQDDLEKLIDIKAADKACKAMRTGDFGFATMDEDDMEKLVNANPNIIRAEFRKK